MVQPRSTGFNRCSRMLSGRFVPCRVIVRTLSTMEDSAFFAGYMYTYRLIPPRFWWRWMRQPKKSKPSSMWATLVFSPDRRRPIGASTAATSERTLGRR